MSGAQSGLSLGSGILLGGNLLALDAPVNFTSGAAEYLRTGSIKAYDASYAASIAAAPQLRVFGNDAKTYGTLTGTSVCRYYYIGTHYFAYIGGGNWQQGTALNSLGTTISLSPNTATVKRLAANGTSYAVCPHSSANTALWYTADGITIAAVGGTFTTFPVASAVGYNSTGTSWIALSTLTATAGEQAYIAAANPSGAWTVGVSTNIGMTSVKAIAPIPAGGFIAVGDSASATAGKIATCSAAGGAWTDRTAGSGLTFAATAIVQDVVYDGTAHILVSSVGVVYSLATSLDNGVTWTARPFPIDQSTVSPLAGAAAWPGYANATFELTTDGAGTVILQYAAMAAAPRAMFAISTDHGVTWSVASPYLGKAPLGSGGRTMSYTNSRWIENHSGQYQSLVDIGTSFATPDYIGQQYQLGAGQYVRIK